jgi:hypothetical protein
MHTAAVVAVVQHQPWVASAWGSTGMIGVIGTFVPKFRNVLASGAAAKETAAVQEG